jgi:hypothetical protein
MTQTTAIATDQHPAQPASPKANHPGRCLFQYPRGRCRLPAVASGFCPQHSQIPEPHDTDDLTPELFGKMPDGLLPPLRTPLDVNDFLARVVVLLAEGRITPRRASVLTYAASLLLRAAIFIDQHTDLEFDYDVPRPNPAAEPANLPTHRDESSLVLAEATR